MATYAPTIIDIQMDLMMGIVILAYLSSIPNTNHPKHYVYPANNFLIDSFPFVINWTIPFPLLRSAGSFFIERPRRLSSAALFAPESWVFSDSRSLIRLIHKDT
jgi:hypothetical protein